MGNKLFQQARSFVTEAIRGSGSKSTEDAVETAQNALSSAFANATDAERKQLSGLQDRLDELK